MSPVFVVYFCLFILLALRWGIAVRNYPQLRLPRLQLGWMLFTTITVLLYAWLDFRESAAGHLFRHSLLALLNMGVAMALARQVRLPERSR
jgi:hypothetical protein